MNTTFPELLESYMNEKRMDDLSLAHKCKISPIKIVNIKKGSHTYSREPVKKIGCGLELNADEMSDFLGVAGF